MASAKKRINSTGRKRIQRERVDIRMADADDGASQAATARFDLQGLGFPDQSGIVLEAYQGSFGMRFNCGTVGTPNIPALLHLNELDRDTTTLFRLKVVEAGGGGKLLGSADRIRPAGNDNEEGKRSIFPIRESDLGDEVWRVEIDDSGPWLLLNYRVPGFKHRLLENPFLRGTMLPAALRVVLERLVFDHTPDDDDEEDWRGMWLRYLRESFGIDDELSEIADEDRASWVDATTRKFCEAHGFVQAIRTMIEGGA